MRKIIIGILASISISLAVENSVEEQLQASTDAWKKRTIYQLLTDRFAPSSGSQGCSNLGNYCGGTYKGIVKNLDYISNMGFDAIWISPVVENIEGGYHGYWASNWEQLNPHFGNEEDLKNLIEECHKRGIWVMVDVVANHVGPVGMDFSRITPFNKNEHYHDRCQINNWNDQHEVEYCRLADLPDLNQDANTYVRDYLKNWIKRLVTTFGFDGIRIDTIPEVSKSFWSEYGKSAGVFQMGEAFNGDPKYVGGYQGPLSAVFNYPMYYTIRDVFQHGQSAYKIRDRYNEIKNWFKDVDALGVFVDNHDNARFLHDNGSIKRFSNAMVFSIFSRGIPFVYYGSEQEYNGGNDPQNREILWNHMDQNSYMYKFLKTTINARKTHKTWDHEHIERYVADNFYAFSRGDIFIATTNTDNTITYPVTYHPYKEGEIVCNIYYPVDCIQVKSGKLQVTLVGGEVKVFLPHQSEFFKQNETKIEEFLN